jgi:hypothetical protein
MGVEQQTIDARLGGRIAPWQSCRGRRTFSSACSSSASSARGSQVALS